MICICMQVGNKGQAYPHMLENTIISCWLCACEWFHTCTYIIIMYHVINHFRIERKLQMYIIFVFISRNKRKMSEKIDFADVCHDIIFYYISMYRNTMYMSSTISVFCFLEDPIATKDIPKNKRTLVKKMFRMKHVIRNFRFEENV